MFINKKINLYKSILLGTITSILFSASVSANLIGSSGLINVTEESFDTSLIDSPFEGGVKYSIDILDESSLLEIGFFAISTNNTTFAIDDFIHTTRYGWVGFQLSASQWNDTFLEYAGGIELSSYGNFIDLFGDDNYVNVYFNLEIGDDMTGYLGSNITTTDDEVFEFYHFDAVPWSNFIALNDSGKLIDKSLAGKTSVPEPSSMAILALGLIGFSVRKLKKN